jgi:prephenate dehydrogenase
VARLFDRAAVVGVGLIGGSLALAARRAGLIGEVVGLGRGEANLKTALERGLVDRVTTDPSALGPVDLVVLAVPVLSTPAVAESLVPHLAPGTVVTDVGSVKGWIVDRLDALLPADRPFVGAHPIAGGERSGAAVAEEDLFEGAPCVITPTERTDRAALERVAALWAGVGARVERMSAAEHDRALGWTSHLVHALAYTLAAGIDGSGSRSFDLAGPSLREATRVAASSPELWRDIFLGNAAAVDESIRRFGADLEALRSAIAAGDGAEIARLLGRGVAARARLSGNR